MMIELSDERFGRLMSLPGAVLLFALVFFPTALLFGLLFFRYNFTQPVKFVGLGNLRAMLTQNLTWRSLKVTVIYTAGVTGISFVGSILISASLSKIGRGKGSASLRTLAMLPFAVPMILVGLIWRWLLSSGTGIFNFFIAKLVPFTSGTIDFFGNPNLAMLAVILADAWWKIPFMTIFILSAMDSINQEIYDSAQVDGADTIRTFRKITLPLSRNGILYAVGIAAMFSFRTIDFIWGMTMGGPMKATYHVGLWIIDNILCLMDLGRAAAVGVVVFGIISFFMSGVFYWMAKEL